MTAMQKKMDIKSRRKMLTFNQLFNQSRIGQKIRVGQAVRQIVSIVIMEFVPRAKMGLKVMIVI